jgi:hypothetical protein
MTATALAHPRHDPDFVDRLLCDLLEHFGEWRPLGRIYAGHVLSHERSQVVRDAVEKARRLGFDIEGDHKRGYRVRGFQLPERVYLVKPGRPSEPERSDVPGQLRLEGASE